MKLKFLAVVLSLCMWMGGPASAAPNIVVSSGDVGCYTRAKPLEICGFFFAPPPCAAKFCVISVCGVAGINTQQKFVIYHNACLNGCIDPFKFCGIQFENPPVGCGCNGCVFWKHCGTFGSGRAFDPKGGGLKCLTLPVNFPACHMVTEFGKDNFLGDPPVVHGFTLTTPATPGAPELNGRNAAVPALLLASLLAMAENRRRSR